MNACGCLNTYIGYQAGFSDPNPTANTYIGLYSGQYAGSSPNGVKENVFIGPFSGQGQSNTTRNNGCGNIFIGRESGRLKSSGNDNVFIGNSTGRNNTTGLNNTFIGAFVATASNYSSTIAIGAYAKPTSNNQLVIASEEAPIGTASSGVFSHFLNTKINGIDVKIPIYY
jgi:hypothetical protein